MPAKEVDPAFAGLQAELGLFVYEDDYGAGELYSLKRRCLLAGADAELFTPDPDIPTVRGSSGFEAAVYGFRGEKWNGNAPDMAWVYDYLTAHPEAFSRTFEPVEPEV